MIAVRERRTRGEQGKTDKRGWSDNQRHPKRAERHTRVEGETNKRRRKSRETSCGPVSATTYNAVKLAENSWIFTSDIMRELDKACRHVE